MRELLITLALGFGTILLVFGNEFGLLGLIPAVLATLKEDVA